MARKLPMVARNAPGEPATGPGVATTDGMALDHICEWVFDLDNTLYPAHCHLFDQIDRRMGEFISGLLDLDFTLARRLQKDYFHHYGTTLRGLMDNHGVDPDQFLTYVHEIDVSVVPESPALVAVLDRLDGRKVVFTNGPRSHAHTILERLGVHTHFDGIFDAADAGYIPKPDPECYRALIANHDIDPKGAILFEDIERNLVPAAALGMTTVLVTSMACEEEVQVPPEDGHATHVHHVTDDLVGWLERVVAARDRDR